MLLPNNLLRLPALFAIGLFALSQTTSAQETVVPASSETESDNANSDTEEGDSRSHGRLHPRTVAENTALRLDSAEAFTFAQVAQTGETEEVIVRGFYVELPPYPALPEVEGTRINSGKKTSFVKPDEFPTISNNNYREALATTPGLLVSEEPSSPIINFGYRGLDSQRAETMQVLKDGISIKNEQFGFPETHYTPILDAVERIEFIRAGAALQFGPQPGGALNAATGGCRGIGSGHGFPFE